MDNGKILVEKLGLGYPFDRLKRLVDAIGPGTTRDIANSARQLDAEEALRIGLVQCIVREQALLQFVNDSVRLREHSRSQISTSPAPETPEK